MFSIFTWRFTTGNQKIHAGSGLAQFTSKQTKKTKVPRLFKKSDPCDIQTNNPVVSDFRGDDSDSFAYLLLVKSLMRVENHLRGFHKNSSIILQDLHILANECHQSVKAVADVYNIKPHQIASSSSFAIKNLFGRILLQ